MPRLKVIRNRILKEIDFSGTPTVGEVLEKAGYMIHHPCGGRGICGKCYVIINGVPELACQYRLSVKDETVEIPNEEEMKQIELRGTDVVFANPMPGKIGTAIDIGTTTVAIRNYDLIKGALINETGFINPQTEVSFDVMGRIGAAVESPDKLRYMNHQIRRVISEELEKSKIVPDSMVITGNTTMLYLFAGMNPERLSHAPFEADCLFDSNIEFGSTIAYMPPCMHAFVGADISCAVMSSEMCDKGEISLLCDLGTNGEIALWKDDELMVSSTAAGPAFEGAGISHGCGSITGAIDSVEIADGTICAHTIEDAKAVGICGSGLIDAIAVFLNLGIIEETGAMEGKEIELRDGISLSPKDISMVQLAKSAIAAGMATMMNEAGITGNDVKKVYIAGGFGSHLNTKSAIRIGLIPEEFSEKIEVIGNASLTGASQLLADVEKLDLIRIIASKAKHINLGGNPMFNNLFIENMLFPVT